MNLNPLPGHPFIHYQDQQLFVENVSVAALIAEHGSPLFVYSKAAILSALKAYQEAFAGRKAHIHYAMKANSSLSILKLLAQAGCGFDIVSGGELERVLAVGGDPSRVIFSGVGKTRHEMRRALELGVHCFNVESAAELQVLNEVASSVQKIAPISLRVNPNVDPKTHPYISTGLKANKFGIAHQDALAVYKHAASLPNISVLGIDCHIGSQITEISPYLDAMDRILDLVQEIEAAGIPIAHIDFGGGLGIEYKTEDKPPSAQALWAQIFARIDARGMQDKTVIVEPGRSLVGNAALCATQVLYLKHGQEKNFCIVDAAMNDLPRPAMYQAYHQVLPLSVRTALASCGEHTYEVVGPVCESGDWLAHDRLLNIEQDDYLAVMSAGAYCTAMASNYNSRARAAEVLVDGENTQLISRRESMQQLLDREINHI